MSYQVLARKWRPANFKEVAGQGHVLKSLINALDNQRLHHAYLFTGTRGVGKTTLARILARCLNCDVGVGSEPCGSCAACTEISEGRFIDLIEVDAASRTKVEDTRELLENVQYTPSQGRYKVYLIDEVHMLSNHSFNALLKTLEEPPPHVKFLFATTDPQKLPITILSRCLQFNLKNLSPKIIVDHLQYVLTEEGLDFEEAALWQIAAAASGSMRDALTLCDQAISYCEGQIRTEGVVEMLGIPDQAQVYELLKAMAELDVAKLLRVVNAMAEQNPDFAQSLDSLLSMLHRIAVAQIMPDAIDNSLGDANEVGKFAQSFSVENIQLFYQIGQQGRGDLFQSAEPRASFEMLMIRMLLFSPDYVHGEQRSEISLAEHSASAEIGSNEKKKTNRKTNIATPAQEATNTSRPQSVGDLTPTQSAQTPSETNSPTPGESLDAITEQQAPVAPRPQEVSLASHTKPLMSQSQWLELLPKLPVSGMLANFFANTVLQSYSETSIKLQLDAQQAALYNEEHRQKMAAVLVEYFGRTLELFVEISEVEAETAAMQRQRLKLEEHQAMLESFENESNVQELVDYFSGVLIKESIKPLG